MSSELEIEKEDIEDFKLKVEQLKSMPTLPHLMMKFSAMAENPETSMTKFGDEVQKDQILTTKLLRLVNSAFYGFPGRIGTVTQAIVLLGLDALKGLIITSSVFDSLTPEAYPLWRHSMLVSLACRQIASMLEYPDIEEIAVAGLLHDIGKVIFFLETPEKYRKVIKYAVKNDMPMFMAEKELIGFNHTDIGRWVCDKWTLPSKLSIPITYHHEPELALEFKERVFIVSAANTIIKGMGVCAEGDVIIDEIGELIQGELNLTPKHINDLVARIEPEIESLENIGPGDLK